MIKQVMNETLMNQTWILLFSFVTGGMLGVIFFAGLWLTVRTVNANQSTHWFLSYWFSGHLFIVSLLLRMSIVLAGLYFVGNGDWKRLLICLFGFVIARFVVIRMTSLRRARDHTKGSMEVGHEFES